MTSLSLLKIKASLIRCQFKLKRSPPWFRFLFELTLFLKLQYLPPHLSLISTLTPSLLLTPTPLSLQSSLLSLKLLLPSALALRLSNFLLFSSKYFPQ